MLAASDTGNTCSQRSQGDEQWNFVTVTSASGKKLYVGLLEACTEEKT